MYNRNQPIRNHSTNFVYTGVRNAGFQNKQPNFYKQGVRVIHGIPYTHEEQYTWISSDQIKNTVITLCREQRRNPNLSELRAAVVDGMYLPEANELIAYSVTISERIQSH